MSADGFFASSASELVEAILEGLRSDESLEPTFGTPIRLYDDETRRPYYPYALLERHETSDTSASETSSFEHQFQFATFSRYGGLREAKSVLGQLRAAIERLDLSLSHQRVILIMSNYCDVMRTQNQTIFRGVLRVRIHTEAI